MQTFHSLSFGDVFDYINEDGQSCGAIKIRPTSSGENAVIFWNMQPIWLPPQTGVKWVGVVGVVS